MQQIQWLTAVPEQPFLHPSPASVLALGRASRGAPSLRRFASLRLLPYWIVRFLRRIDFSRVVRLSSFGFLLNHSKGLGSRYRIPVYVADSPFSLPLSRSFQNFRNMTGVDPNLLFRWKPVPGWLAPEAPAMKSIAGFYGIFFRFWTSFTVSN